MSIDRYAGLCEIAGKENVLRDEPMNRHTTFRIGGPADYLVSPVTEGQLAGLLSYCRETDCPFFLLGNGSNLLVGDGGFRGVVIQLFRNWNEIRQEENVFHAKAGAMLSTLAKMAQSSSLTGLEFASGIPGTLGGAVMMNAGAYGGEMKDVVTSVRAMDTEGQIHTFTNEQMEFGYRTSLVERGKLIVLEASLELTRGDGNAIAERMEELREKRTSKQPLELPSAGSTFKRPEGYFAGKLIMEAGLAGFSVGGAQVSPKHCGFVVNTGGATAKDVRTLMEKVQETVKEQTGVWLEPEVRMLGEFAE